MRGACGALSAHVLSNLDKIGGLSGDCAGDDDDDPGRGQGGGRFAPRPFRTCSTGRGSSRRTRKSGSRRRSGISNYRPHEVARSLRRSRTGTIGVDDFRYRQSVFRRSRARRRRRGPSGCRTLQLYPLQHRGELREGAHVSRSSFPEAGGRAYPRPAGGNAQAIATSSPRACLSSASTANSKASRSIQS